MYFGRFNYKNIIKIKKFIEKRIDNFIENSCKRNDWYKHKIECEESTNET